MHVSRFFHFAAPTPSRIAATPVSRKNPSSRFFGVGPWTLPLIAMFAMLALCSRTVQAATYIVTDLSDNASDTGSLRYAVNTAVDGDTIGFGGNVIGTIPLTNGSLTISHSITIAGPGPNLLTISAANNGNNVAFRINSGTVSIGGLTIANSNTVSPGGGGYVGGALSNSGSLTLSSCAIIDNTGGDGAGGIANQGTMTIDDCTISNNTAALNVGGGIVNSGTMLLENSTITGNKTSNGSSGGGIYNMGSLTIGNSTISGNTAGGGIYNGSGLMGPAVVTLVDSIVAGNTGSDCDNCGSQTAPNLIGGTPDLGPLQYNGGNTRTMMPLPGSPAIGAGSGSTLATDQRGFARSTSGASDLGAVSTNYLTVTTTADSTETTTCTGGATCSLRDAINLANSDGSGDIIFQSGLTGPIILQNSLPEISGNVTINGTSATPLEFPNFGPAPFEIFLQSGANVSLSGLTIGNTGNGVPSSSIALVYNGGGTLAVNGCTFSGYDDQMAQGVLLNDSGTLMVTNSTFSGNSTQQGAIFNNAPATVTNSTFSGNTAFESGAIYNQGPLLVADSTISGNNALNVGYGGGIHNNSGTPLIVTNSIVAGNTSGSSPSAPDDCENCGTQNPSNMIGGSPDLGALALNGLNATVQTMIPLPGSPAIQAGDPTQLPVGLTNDERGFPRLTAGKLDLGAVQTNYTAVAFVQQPTNTVFNTAISPAVTVEVLETNNNLSAPNNTDVVDNVPITLTLNGSGTLGGTLTQTTSGVASFGDLTVSAPGTGDTLATSLTVTPSGITPAQTLTATSNPFDVTLELSTVSFNPPLPASVTYGVAPLMLNATALSSGTATGQTVSFQVDSGPATVNGNVLTITGAGTVVVEVDAAANATYAAASTTETILVGLAQSQLALTASATQAPMGSSVILTATATSTTSGVPTGSVTFLDNGNDLGAVPLNAQGVATLTLTTLPAGSNTITARYPGDTNFLGSQAQLAGTILVGTPGFSMTASSSTLSVQPGLVGSISLTLTPAFGYTGTVTLGCSGMPVKSTCVFQPVAVTFNGSGSSVQVNLTMEIGPVGLLSRGASVAVVRPLTPLGSLPILPAMIFWLPDNFSDPWRKRKLSEQRKTRTHSSRWLRLAVLLLFGAGLLGLTGCANNAIDFNSPPIGQYTVTITAAGSGNVSQSVNVQLHVL